jgi:AraC family transcriptional regulator of adaptative response / DNA-3-methyladenine glycosylase II
VPSVLSLRLAARAPLDAAALLGVLAARAAPGLERVAGTSYARTLRLPHGPAVVVLALGADAVGGSWGTPGASAADAPGADPGAPTGPDAAAAARTDEVAAISGVLRSADARDRDDAVARLRRLLDLDADPAVVDAHLASDPALAPLVARRPGLRVLGAVDGFELALRAVLGQQVSVAAARTVLGRIVLAHGPPVPDGLDPATGPDPAGPAVGGARRDGVARRRVEDPGRLRLLPAPETVAELRDEDLAMPRSRAATVRRVAAAVAAGELDLAPGGDPADAVAALLALPGVGPWTAGYVAMRALGDRDAFPATDLVLRQGAAALGLPSDARGLTAHAARWSPWRAYAAQHLWAAAADARAAR